MSMCVLCQIREQIRGAMGDGLGVEFEVVGPLAGRHAPDSDRADRVADLCTRTLDAVKAHAGDRSWVHGLLFRYCLDRESLIELARDLGISPRPFAAVGDDGVTKIADWNAVYEAVVDRATEEFPKHMNNPRAAAARRFSDLLTVLCGQPTDAESAWLAELRN
jgi:hypothetical protein